MNSEIEIEKEKLAFKGLTFPCPLCRNGLDIRINKNAKPYVVCDPCAMQMFVRNSAGRDKLLALRTIGPKIWKK